LGLSCLLCSAGVLTSPLGASALLSALPTPRSILGTLPALAQCLEAISLFSAKQLAEVSPSFLLQGPGGLTVRCVLPSCAASLGVRLSDERAHHRALSMAFALDLGLGRSVGTLLIGPPAVHELAQLGSLGWRQDGADLLPSGSGVLSDGSDALLLRRAQFELGEEALHAGCLLFPGLPLPAARSVTV